MNTRAATSQAPATRTAPPPGGGTGGLSEQECRERLLKAFPEIDLERFVDDKGTNNRHNVEERFGSTISSVMQWVKDSTASS